MPSYRPCGLVVDCPGPLSVSTGSPPGLGGMPANGPDRDEGQGDVD